MLFYVSRDHHHFSYGKGSSKLQIFTLPHTDPARLFCRKSLRCATNKSTKNLGCASAILSILGWKRGGGGALAPPPKYLPKFVDFVSEKGSESQGCRNEELFSYVFEEATRIDQKYNILSYIQVKNFLGKTFIRRDSLLPSKADFPKIGRFPTIY